MEVWYIGGRKKAFVVAVKAKKEDNMATYFEMHTEDVNIICQPCTAICPGFEGDEEQRVDAVFVQEFNCNSGETYDHVVFGWKCPTCEGEYSDMYNDAGPYEWDSRVEDCHVVLSVDPDEYYGALRQTR